MESNEATALDRRDPLWVLNEYRAAEVHGAGAIMRMGRLADSTELSANLSRHLRDEAVHAWLWTKAINNSGGEIAEVDLPYQARLGMHYRIPSTLRAGWPRSRAGAGCAVRCSWRSGCGLRSGPGDGGVVPGRRAGRDQRRGGAGAARGGFL